MELEQSPQVIGKRLWNIVRIVLYMMRKGISKSKLMLDLQMMLKRGKVLGKAIENLMLQHQHHYAALTCRPDDVHTSFISPREYEFSCSNTPVYPSFYTKRKHNHHHQHHDNSRYHLRYHQKYRKEAESGINVVEKVIEMLNNHGSVEASPMSSLPGFGCSPTVRQLRVTDSPFPLKENEENPQVDTDAEEFIKKFYKELKKQRRIAALESPSPSHISSK